MHSQPTPQTLLTLAQAELDTLHQFGVAIHAPRDPAPLFQLLYQLAKRIMPIDASFIAMYDAQSGTLSTRFSVDKDIEYPGDACWQPSEGGPTEWLISHAAPIRFRDFNRELPYRFPRARITNFGDGEESRSWMAVPMLISRQIKGVINVQSYQEGVYNEREERMLLTLGSMLAVAVERAQLIGRLERWRQALSAPLIPISNQLLILPLIGQLDQQRMELAQRSMLEHLMRQRARNVLLDMTGVTELSDAGALWLERLARTVRMLGTGCMISGLSAALAGRLAERHSSLLTVPIVRDVAEGLARAGSDAAKGIGAP